jgi:hypothetical protein
MIITLEIEGQLVEVDLDRLAGSEVAAVEESPRKEPGKMPIQFASEGYQFALDLADLVSAESIEEAEKQVLCWRPDEAAEMQPGG